MRSAVPASVFLDVLVWNSFPSAALATNCSPKGSEDLMRINLSVGEMLCQRVLKCSPYL